MPCFCKSALRLVTQIEHKKWITTWPVVTEVCHLLGNQNASFAISLLLTLYENGGFDIFSITKNHSSIIIKLLDKYQDLPMDLADASLVLLANELGHGTIVSTDIRDLNTYRFKNHKPFNNIF